MPTTRSGNLPQAQSDAILRDAVGKLQGIEKQLAAGAGKYEHHTLAKHEVRQAIHHLNVALEIR